MEALAPYLKYIEDIDVERFAEECNEHGWFSFRQNVLDAGRNKRWDGEYANEDNAFAALDKMLGQAQSY